MIILFDSGLWGTIFILNLSRQGRMIPKPNTFRSILHSFIGNSMRNVCVRVCDLASNPFRIVDCHLDTVRYFSTMTIHCFFPMKWFNRINKIKTLLSFLFKRNRKKCTFNHWKTHRAQNWIGWELKSLKSRHFARINSLNFISHNSNQ